MMVSRDLKKTNSKVGICCKYLTHICIKEKAKVDINMYKTPRFMVGKVSIFTVGLDTRLIYLDTFGEENIF